MLYYTDLIRFLRKTHILLPKILCIKFISRVYMTAFIC